MPFYDYYCIYCDTVDELFHDMTEDRTNDPCSTCDEVQALRRLPPSGLNVKQETNIGNVVKEFIAENKEINKKEKERLSKQEFTK